MHKIEFESGGRSMRWYEWLAGLFLLGAAMGLRAAPIYKCVDAEQHITYQQESCGSAQTQSPIAIAPAPRFAPSPQYRVEPAREQRVAHSERSVHERAPHETAYECRASDGRLFYRLGACPHSIAAAQVTPATSRSRQGKSGGAHAGTGGSIHVAAQRVPLDLACREIHRAGAIGRDGHEFDEHVSTYERDLGHDPCKS